MLYLSHISASFALFLKAAPCVQGFRVLQLSQCLLLLDVDNMRKWASTERPTDECLSVYIQSKTHLLLFGH